jgi:hypothetical protein
MQSLTGFLIWLAGLLSLVLVQVHTALADTATQRMSGEGYSSMLEAVRAASDKYNPVSIATDTEHFGVIFKKEVQTSTSAPRFTYTHAAVRSGQDSFRFKVRPAPDETLVAIWHTHGRRHPLHRFFSECDIATAHKLGLPFYLADYTGILKVYDPANGVSGYSTGKKAGRVRSDRSGGTVVKDVEANAVRIRVR